MAALTRGTLREHPRVSLVRMLTSRGRTSDAHGASNTSSKVRPSPSNSIFIGSRTLHTRLLRTLCIVPSESGRGQALEKLLTAHGCAHTVVASDIAVSSLCT